MNSLHVLILSIIEGITEFLPVSSTGHLILATKLLHIPESDFSKSFDIFIQLGAIMAVVSLYFARIRKEPMIIKPILIAFLPTGVLGVVFYKIIKSYLFGNDMVVVLALGGVGALLIMLERYWKKHPISKNTTIMTLKTKDLLTIGFFQSFSMVPGVSRAASTIVGGMLTGLNRKEAVEFSFLLAVPTMAAATGLDLLKSAHNFTANELVLLGAGFLISWITAFLVIKTFIRMVANATFTGFGYYRIAIAMLYWLIVTV